MILGIDASRCRSGGAVAHLKGILSHFEPDRYRIAKIHLWTYPQLHETIQDYPWLVKHAPVALSGTLSKQLYWQATRLKKELNKNHCDLLFTADASTLCRFRPQVVLSQDMQSYEPGIMQLYGWSKARLRLQLILLLQNRAFRYADGVIFLTRYASEIIQRSVGKIQNYTCIPHGVGEEFRGIQKKVLKENSSIRCIYISNAAPYKHQAEVVKAIELLRKQGRNVSLTLLGGGKGEAQEKLEKQMRLSDPNKEYIVQKDLVPHNDLPDYLANADIFIFASSCENMPVTLIEGMSAGLPVASSNRGPMPEVLGDAGVYFDPEDPVSITNAVEKLISDPFLMQDKAEKAAEISKQYSWSRCAEETWTFIRETFEKTNHQ